MPNAREVDPQKTPRAYAFKMWMPSPMPMATFFKTLNVSRLVKTSAKKNLKFNMLMCHCIGKAASEIREFRMLPVGDKLMEFDSLAVSVMLLNKNGEVNSCDIPFSESLFEFNADYLTLTKQTIQTCANHDLKDYMCIGTSALAKYDIDWAVNIYSGIFKNPFLIWSKYKRGIFKTTINISFQFHHTQMDGSHAAHFLNELQRQIDTLTPDA